jgi:hypothetical protein
MTDLRELLPQVIEVLTECAEFLDDQADVDDGDYGTQVPNKAMRLAQFIADVLAKLETVK